MNILLYIVLGIIGLVAFLYILGVLVSKQERKNAPANLEKALKSFSKNDQLESINYLKKAFYVPIDEKYSAEDARTALKALELLEKLVDSMGMKKTSMIDDLKPSLKKASIGGGTVSAELTEPVADFLEAFSGNDVNSAANALMKMAGEDVEIREKDYDDFTDLLTEDESKHINIVGKMIMKGDVDGAIDYLNGELENPHISDPLFATLVEQRAGCFFMKKRYEWALKDYNSVLSRYPGNKRVLSGIKDVKRKM